MGGGTGGVPLRQCGGAVVGGVCSGPTYGGSAVCLARVALSLRKVRHLWGRLRAAHATLHTPWTGEQRQNYDSASLTTQHSMSCHMAMPHCQHEITVSCDGLHQLVSSVVVNWYYQPGDTKCQCHQSSDIVSLSSA